MQNDTGEPIVCSGLTLARGNWKGSATPPPSIGAGQSITFECDSALGNVSGWVSYTGARGGVTITWDVPLVLGDPSYSATCSGVYMARRQGNPTPEAGGVMFSIQAPPASAVTTTSVPVAPAAPGGTAAPITVAPKGDGKKYTTSPNEVTTVRTAPSIGEVVGVLKGGWTELTEQGARTLASQWGAETSFGKFCFNFNFGNVKASVGEQHMYLHGVWELLPPSGADKAVAAAGGLAHIATDDEIKKHGWACDAAHKIVVFEPPHTACRFAAFSTLADGCAGYIKKHKGYAAQQSGYLAAINAADIDQVAHILKVIGYYTAPEASYASGMKRCKGTIDKALGPAPDAPPTSAAASPQP